MSLLTLFFALLAITSPIGNTAIFVSMTQGIKRHDLIKITLRTSVATFFVLLLSAFIGMPLLDGIGVSMKAFIFASGLVLMKIGFSMFSGSTDSSHYNSDEHDRDITSCAIVPLTIPLFAGPGAIAVVVHYASLMSMSLMSLLGFLFVVLLISLIIAVCMYSTTIELVQDVIRKKSVIGVVTRVFGLLVIAIGSEMFLVGLQSFLK